jgi:thioredoxin 1
MAICRSILARATFAAGTALILCGCTEGADARTPAGSADSTTLPAAETPPAPPVAAPVAPAPKPAPAPAPTAAAPAPPPPEPPKLPAASPESVRKVKALLARMDSESADERSAAWEELKEMGDLAAPALAEALAGGSVAERRGAVEALSRIKDKATWPAVRKALSDADAGVRWRAARAAGDFGDAGAKGALCGLVKDDKDEDVRRHAAYALACLGADEGFAYYKEELKSNSATRRSQAALALGKYGKGKFIQELSGALKDPEVRVRTAAVRELSEAKEKEAIPALIFALGDDDYKIRERARAGLERLTFMDDFGTDKAKWDEWWAKTSGTYKVSTDGQPEAHKWVNATGLKGEADFKKHVEEAKGLVVVDFHLPRDRDCVAVARVLDKLAADYKGKLSVCEAEAQPNMAVVRKLALQTAPSLVFFRDGKKLEIVAGRKTVEEFKKIFDEHLDGTRKIPEQPEAPPPGKDKEDQLKATAEFPDLKDEADFKAKVEASKGLLLLDFHADWCVWCHRLTPVLNKLVKDYQGKATFLGIDADANAGLKERFNVEGLPTMVIFKDGKPVETVVGFKKEEDLKAILDKHLAGARKPDPGPAPAPDKAKEAPKEKE